MTATPFPLNAYLEVELDHMIVLFLASGALSVLFFHGRHFKSAKCFSFLKFAMFSLAAIP